MKQLFQIRGTYGFWIYTCIWNVCETSRYVLDIYIWSLRKQIKRRDIILGVICRWFSNQKNGSFKKACKVEEQWAKGIPFKKLLVEERMSLKEIMLVIRNGGGETRVHESKKCIECWGDSGQQCQILDVNYMLYLLICSIKWIN